MWGENEQRRQPSQLFTENDDLFRHFNEMFRGFDEMFRNMGIADFPQSHTQQGMK